LRRETKPFGGEQGQNVEIGQIAPLFNVFDVMRLEEQLQLHIVMALRI
jgi:hypothetical protein